MAEAHQAVSYSKLVRHDQHTSDNHDKEHLQFVCESKSKSWEKWLNQIARKLCNAVYPAHVQSFGLILLLVMGLHFGGRKVPFDLVNIVRGLLSGYIYADLSNKRTLKNKNFPMNFSTSSLALHVTACFISGLLFWLFYCVIMKSTLKILLTYRGFMFEARGKSVSLKTKIWGLMLKSGFN